MKTNAIARSAGLSLLFAATAVVPFLACGGNKQEASFSLNNNGVDGGFSSSSGGPAGQPCAPGQPCPPPSNCAPGQPCPPPAASSAPPAGSGDPNQLAALLAAAAAAGSAWLGPAAAVADPAEAGMRAAAAQYAPGMSPDGPVAKGNLAEGGHIGFIANMDPSRCYTVVAYGAGVLDLDVNLLAPPLYNFLAGSDGMAGPTAVIGGSGKPMCPIIPAAVPYKVDLYAKRGGGPVAAQLYSKPK